MDQVKASDHVLVDDAVQQGTIERLKELREYRRQLLAGHADAAEAALVASNNAVRVVATQIIHNFATAKADDVNRLSRTGVAIRMLDTQLNSRMLANRNAMNGGKHAAKKALVETYDAIQLKLKEIDRETSALGAALDSKAVWH